MKKKVNKKKDLTKIILLIIAIIIVIALIATLCYGYFKKMTYKPGNPIATMEIENYGTIKIELYPDMAPNTVNNFIALANSRFYDGLTFHRIIKDFMIQGGAPTGDETGAPTLKYIENDINNDTKYNIDGEFIENGYEKNTLKLEKGVIAMARGDYSSYASFAPSLVEEGYNSAGSQFFIMTTDENMSLTGYYAGFGKVIEGLDVLEKIAATKVKAKDKEDTEKSTPVNTPVITSITVDTKGVNYEKPKTHEPFDINRYFSPGLSY